MVATTRTTPSAPAVRRIADPVRGETDTSVTTALRMAGEIAVVVEEDLRVGPGEIAALARRMTAADPVRPSVGMAALRMDAAPDGPGIP